MSEVASLENCKRLYELSGWKDTESGWLASSDWETGEWNHQVSRAEKKRWVAGAYDAGYLLRKLPKNVANDKNSYFFSDLYLKPHVGETWNAGYRVGASFPNYSEVADTPEDALCLLAIKLFEGNVLTKGDSSHDQQ